MRPRDVPWLLFFFSLLVESLHISCRGHCTPVFHAVSLSLSPILFFSFFLTLSDAQWNHCLQELCFSQGLMRLHQKTLKSYLELSVLALCSRALICSICYLVLRSVVPLHHLFLSCTLIPKQNYKSWVSARWFLLKFQSMFVVHLMCCIEISAFIRA